MGRCTEYLQGAEMKIGVELDAQVHMAREHWVR